jgi:hypothetical protein
MKQLTVLIVGLGLFAAGCTETAPSASGLGDSAEMPGKSAEALSVAVAKAEIGSEAFIRHMHFHASQLKRLNAALAAEDLDAAQTPAYWLSAHETIVGAPMGWQRHIKTMREAAVAINDAKYIEAARVAARRVTVGCKRCHAEAGVDVPSLELD